MHTAKVKIEGISPYSASRHISSPKLNKETAEAHEQRVWRERLHYDENGEVYIPPMCFKNALSEAARYVSMQIPGKGKSTYTKHFEAGVMVTDPLKLGVKKDDVPGEWLHVPSDGRRGGTSRVDKCFPVIKQWGGVLDFIVLDDTITSDVLAHHLKEAGRFIGVGRFRPRMNGFYGRFTAEIIEWS